MADLSNGLPNGTSGASLQDYREAQKAAAQQQAAGYTGLVQHRAPVTREDLVDMSLKLQEALSLITQALGRMR